MFLGRFQEGLVRVLHLIGNRGAPSLPKSADLHPSRQDLACGNGPGAPEARYAEAQGGGEGGMGGVAKIAARPRWGRGPGRGEAKIEDRPKWSRGPGRGEAQVAGRH